MIAVFRAICAATLCVSMPMGATAQDAASSQAPVAAPATAVQSPAYRLAMLTNPIECFDVSPGSAAANGLSRMIAADPNIREIEADHVGYTAYVTSVIITHTQANRGRLAEEAWAALAPVLEGGMSPLQLSQANSFYATEAGRRLVRDICANTDMQIIGDAMVASGDYSVDAQAIDRTLSGAANASMSAIAAYPARDRAAVTWFLQTEANRAMAALRPTLVATIAEVSNRPDPAFDAAIERDIDRFFERAAKGGKPARAP